MSIQGLIQLVCDDKREGCKRNRAPTRNTVASERLDAKGAGWISFTRKGEVVDMCPVCVMDARVKIREEQNAARKREVREK